MQYTTYKKVTGPTPGKVYYVQADKFNKFLAYDSSISKEDMADFVVTNGVITKSRCYSMEDLIEGFLNIHLYK